MSANRRADTPVLALPFNPDLLARWRGRLPAFVEAGVVVLLALQAARLLWLVFNPTGPVGMPEAALTTTATAPMLGRSDVFFRQMTLDAGNRGTTGALGYTLFGVRGGGSHTGSAILGNADGQQAAYRLGDAIAPGLVLDAVGADHVILRSGGARQRIDLPGRPTASPTPAAAAPGVLPTGAPARNAAAPDAIDPQHLLAQAGLRPRSEGGYTVIPRGDGAVLRQAGLQSGDVLLSVNGQTLTPERLGELNEELKGQPEIAITFERDGQTRTVTLPASPP